MREDRRRRYDDGFRREALELIKSGAGKDALARRLAIPVYTARNWIRLYRFNGEEAVMGGGGSRRYDWETKVAAARDHVENGLTKTEAMARHGIASIASLERWCRDYRSGGPEALRPKPKGRPKGAKSKPKPEPTREQELAEQVAYLKAKVAYLENSGPCGRPSHAARAKRRRPTARRAGTPARPPPEDSRAAEIHVLPPPVAPGARVQAGRGADGTGDMGWQYQHQWWRDELGRLGIRQSMSRKGSCLDNAATEQVFGHLKDEFYRGREFDSYIVHWTPDDARYDSRDAPRRSSGACPSRSDPVSQLTTSNKRGAVQ